MKCFLNTGKNKAELLTLILEHSSPVLKLLYKTLEIQWLLPNLIKFNKKLVADFVKGFFLGPKTHKISLPPATLNVYLAFLKARTWPENSL